jgi:hypothetical protein
MHIVAVIGIAVLVLAALWALAHFVGLWGVLTLSIGLGGHPGVKVEPNQGFQVRVPPVSAPAAPAQASALTTPTVSSETKQVLAAIENLSRAQQARDEKQDGRMETIERRLDGLTTPRPAPAPGPDCFTGGPNPRFGPPQTVSPR